MGEGVEATTLLHSSNISKTQRDTSFTEDMLRKAVIFDRILCNKLGRTQRERDILESRRETIRASLRQVSLLAGPLEKRSFHPHLVVFSTK
jgi:hypothetical protein